MWPRLLIFKRPFILLIRYMYVRLIIAAVALFVICISLNSVSGFVVCDLLKNMKILHNSQPGPTLNNYIMDNLQAIQRCAPKGRTKVVETDIANIRSLLSVTPVNITQYKGAITTLKNNLGITTKLIFSIY